MSATLVKRQHSQPTTFKVIERRVQNRHNFQFYVDFGVTTGGPWLKVGVNETELAVGYLPTPRPAQKVKTVEPAVG
jgi:hypothetical protein